MSLYASQLANQQQPYDVAKPAQPLLTELHQIVDVIFDLTNQIECRVRGAIGGPVAAPTSGQATTQPPVPTLLGLRARLDTLRAGLFSLNSDVSTL